MSSHSVSSPSQAPRVTVRTLARLKTEGQKITMLTAADASFSRHLDEAGIDAVLVGDSLGNVVQGRDTTVGVTLDDMVYHTRCVRRGLTRAMLIADMPFMSYRDAGHCMEAATLLMQAGAEMVKLEGAGPMIQRVAELTEQGIPVCAHLGLTPQSVHHLGGFHVQGRDQETAQQLAVDARSLQDAGAAMLVLECVPRGLAAAIRTELRIPVIGIGAGAAVDGQVLVLYDALGITFGRRPRFSRDFLAEGGSIPGAIREFISAVREERFPSDEHGWD